MARRSKALHENFARFFENPTRDGLRRILQENFGELDHLDFKAEWPEGPKLSRHALALANSGGGCVVVGVSQLADGSIQPTGIAAFVDKAVVSKAMKKYVPEQLQTEVLDFVFEAAEYPLLVGKKFQVLLVFDEPRYLPFVSMADSDKAIRRAAVYVRRGTSSEEATFEELQSIINRRVETGYSSSGEIQLAAELAELKTLYQQIDPYKHSCGLDGSYPDERAYFGDKPAGLGNFAYPDEDYDSFVCKVIRLKKERIQSLLRVPKKQSQDDWEWEGSERDPNGKED